MILLIGLAIIAYGFWVLFNVKNAGAWSGVPIMAVGIIIMIIGALVKLLG